MNLAGSAISIILTLFLDESHWNLPGLIGII